MVTRITSESGASIEVSRATVHFTVGLRRITIEDDGRRSRISSQITVRGIPLPIPLKEFRPLTYLSPEHSNDVIWVGGEFHRVTFKKS